MQSVLPGGTQAGTAPAQQKQHWWNLPQLLTHGSGPEEPGAQAVGTQQARHHGFKLQSQGARDRPAVATREGSTQAPRSDMYLAFLWLLP